MCCFTILRAFPATPYRPFVAFNFRSEISNFFCRSRLRRSIPYYKQQSDSKFEGSSSGTDLQLKIEPNPTDETGTYENCDYQAHDDQQQQDDHEDEEEQVGEEDAQGQEEVEPEPKPQIYNIKYMVPSSLIIREHSSEQRRNEPPVHSFQHPMEQRREPPPLSFPQSSNGLNFN